ncbi:uncharacterized protein BDZ99DRAFT_565206 [Mytilinidion resinicola]|uniref:Uncharacterized protein n=1 Tax=Mytilinidion resinicola TaxID=574789 RepID=A0A6A6Z8W7_9PEZI|nr:uncharacterized protein BDZ99DRAFT_565206 [Mytilinidion resinicola]KAF2817456.1 hypothetical protein BDZ99DRAFT_565206 [Mytilinidion resinicola]
MPAKETREITYGSYRHLVVKFSQRNFRYDSDRADDFSGITNSLTELRGEEFIFGMPRLIFEMSLSWVGYSDRRSTRCSIPGSNTPVELPNWSWARSALFKVSSERKPRSHYVLADQPESPEKFAKRMIPLMHEMETVDPL